MARTKSRAVSNRDAVEDTVADTYTQETVEIDAARIEGAMKVIDRILNRIILGDEIDESVARVRMIGSGVERKTFMIRTDCARSTSNTRAHRRVGRPCA
jgi:hypothetical protein